MLKQVIDTRGKREFTGVRGGANRLDYPSVIQNGHGIAREIGLSSELRNRPTIKHTWRKNWHATHPNLLHAY
jgi:hypothetical protein